MSYKRSARKLIPKNSDTCMGCKLRNKFMITKREESTNSNYKNCVGYYCSYLKIKSSNETIYDSLINNMESYSEEELKREVDNIHIRNKLHNSIKACGLYTNKENRKNTNRFKNVSNLNEEIPF